MNSQGRQRASGTDHLDDALDAFGRTVGAGPYSFTTFTQLSYRF